MSKLKILVAIPTSFCFGLQHVTVDLFAASSESIDPHFLVTRWNNGEFITLLQKHNFPYTESWLGMFSRKVDWRNLKMSIHALSKIPRLYVDFIRLVGKLKPDLILFANHHELILLLPVLSFMHTKVICHMHDPPPAIPFQKRTFRRYGKRVDRFIAISRDVGNRLVHLGCDPVKITVVHNGINSPVTSVAGEYDFRSKFGWPVSSFVIGITGQMTYTKGHEDVLAAFAKIHNQNPNVRLLIGGKKLEPLYSDLQKQIAALELESKVGFTDWLDDVNVFYSNIDLFILASRHDEGYGLVVAEAMLRGKPVIITRSGGAVEIVNDSVNGFIVEKRDVNMMAEKMLLISQDNDLRKRLADMAVSRITEYFTIEKAATNFVRALKSV